MERQGPIEAFQEKVRWLHEPEYGDFKRKVGLYIIRLEEELRPELTPFRKQILSQMRNEIVFAPAGDINLARKRALELAEQLIHGGH